MQTNSSCIPSNCEFQCCINNLCGNTFMDCNNDTTIALVSIGCMLLCIGLVYACWRFASYMISEDGHSTKQSESEINAMQKDQDKDTSIRVFNSIDTDVKHNTTMEAMHFQNEPENINIIKVNPQQESSLTIINAPEPEKIITAAEAKTEQKSPLFELKSSTEMKKEDILIIPIKDFNPVKEENKVEEIHEEILLHEDLKEITSQEIHKEEIKEEVKAPIQKEEKPKAILSSRLKIKENNFFDEFKQVKRRRRNSLEIISEEKLEKNRRLSEESEHTDSLELP